MGPAITLALQLLPVAEKIYEFIAKTRRAAQQTGEWTPEAEAAWQQSLLTGARDSAHQPD